MVYAGFADMANGVRELVSGHWTSTSHDMQLLVSAVRVCYRRTFHHRVSRVDDETLVA